MNSLEARILEMLIRVRQFGVAHASDFPASSRGRELFDSVNQFINTIETHSATHAQHTRAAKEKTTQKNAALEALREAMTAIARTARGMERTMPGVQDRFRMPTGMGVQELLATARAFRAGGEQLRDEFIRRGMPSNFVEDFDSRIDRVEEGVDGRAQKSAARVSSKAAISDAAQNAREAVRELDPIVRNVYVTNASALAEWESASHLERAPRRAEPEASPAPPAPAND